MKHWVAALLLLLAPPMAPASQVTLTGTAQVAFTPGDDAAGLVQARIDQARLSIRVQAYSFTHPGIAKALVEARARGIDVRVIADPEQVRRQPSSQIPVLARQGVPVWLDGQHAAAHDKVMIIDAERPEGTVITGSFNFTRAAQFRNSENLLILTGVSELTRAYTDNWHRHLLHSIPYRP